MKSFRNLKVAVFSLLLFFITTASANVYILKGDNYILDKRVQDKILDIGNELKVKTGVNVYVYVKSSLGFDKKLPIKEKIQLIKAKELQIVKNLNKPYVVLSMSVEDKYLNILTTDKLKSIINKDDILNDYVIPLLASKDKNELYAKVSASVLNGYAQISQVIADSKDVKLESNIGNSGKVTGTIWKVFMYTLIVGGLLLYIYAIMRRKK